MPMDVAKIKALILKRNRLKRALDKANDTLSAIVGPDVALTTDARVEKIAGEYEIKVIHTNGDAGPLEYAVWIIHGERYHTESLTRARRMHSIRVSDQLQGIEPDDFIF